MARTQDIGRDAEDRAEALLATHGLQPISRNYRCRGGEIDLVMRDRDCVCFVEVKYRQTAGFGGAAGAVTPAKRRRIVSAALYFLAANRKLMHEPLRFDVFLIEGRGDDDAVEWIRNAFYAE